MSERRRASDPQVVEVIHPGLAGVSKKDLQEKLAKMYKVRYLTRMGWGGWWWWWW